MGSAAEEAMQAGRPFDNRNCMAPKRRSTSLELGPFNRRRSLEQHQCVAGEVGPEHSRHCNCIHSLDWHPKGLLLASGSSDETIKIWDTARSVCSTTLQRHTDWVFSVCWHMDGVRRLL